MKFQKGEVCFILTLCIIATAMTLVLMDLNSINPDETVNLLIGRSILEGKYGEEPGTYLFDFMHRPPMIPSLVSLSLLMGIGMNGTRILIPLLFMNLLIIATYVFAKTLYGKWEAIIATLFLFTFPFFWRWGFSILADIPLALFSVMFLLFFYLGVEKKRKYLPLSAISFILGLMLKQSIALFIIPAFLYLLMRRKLSILKTKEAIISIILIPAVFIAVFLIFQVSTSASISLEHQATFFSTNWDISEMFKFVFAPTVIFSLVGIVMMRRRKENLLVFASVMIYLIFFIWTGHLRFRYLMPLIPLLGILAGMGFMRIRKFRIANIFLIALLAIAFINSLYIIQLEESTLWGADELSEYVSTLNGTVFTNYLPHYLKATTKNKIANLSESDYIVLSIYEDYGRNGTVQYYYPTFGPFEIPIKRPYCNGRVPSDYEFSSELYEEIDSSFGRVNEIFKGNQIIFIIYGAK